MNNADLIVATLKAAGIDRGFGIPSGNVLPLMEAMRAGGIEFVLTAHEGSAGFAADVMGRMTGAPGLCIATLGPGATNLAPVVGGVHLDRAEDVALAPANEPVPALAEPDRLAAAPEAAIARAAALIGSAKRPIAVLGASAMRLRDPALLQKFVERHRLPFASTTMAK